MYTEKREKVRSELLFGSRAVGFAGQLFGRTILAARKFEGFSQAEVAGLIDVSSATLSGIEFRGKAPSTEAFLMLCVLFDLEPLSFIGVSE